MACIEKTEETWPFLVGELGMYIFKNHISFPYADILITFGVEISVLHNVWSCFDRCGTHWRAQGDHIEG